MVQNIETSTASLLDKQIDASLKDFKKEEKKLKGNVDKADKNIQQKSERKEKKRIVPNIREEGRLALDEDKEEERKALNKDHEAWLESQKANRESTRALSIRQQVSTLYSKVHKDDYSMDPDHKLSMKVDDGKEVSVNFKMVRTPEFSEWRVPVLEITVKDRERVTDWLLTFQNSKGKPGGPWDAITVKVFVGDKQQTEESCVFGSANFERESTGNYLNYLNGYAEKLIAQYQQEATPQQEK